MNYGPRSLLIVGDSIALGATDVFGTEIRQTATPTFAELLRQRLEGWTIDVDASVHRTSTQTVACLPQLMAAHRPDLVLLVVGGSDVDLDWKRFIVSRGKRVQNITKLDKFEQSLRRLIGIANEWGAYGILSDLPSHDLAKRGKWLSEQTGQDVLPWIEAAGGQAESDRHHDRYSRVIEHVAHDTRADVARWAAAIAAMPAQDRFGPDATHPSTAAHRVIADTVAERVSASAPRRPARITA